MSAAIATASIYKQRPLEEDLLATGPLRTKSKKRKAKRDEDEPSYVDSIASRKILKIGQELQEEDRAASRATQPNSAFTFESRLATTSDPDPEEEEKYDDEEAWGGEDGGVTEEAEIDPHDLDLFHKFIPAGEEPTLDLKATAASSQEQGTNLADLILRQIAAHEAAQANETEVLGGGPPEEAIEIPAKVVEVYTKVGMILSRYKSGKLPKPFRILPTLPQWEDLLAITRPESWTPNACFQATRIFVSAKPQVVRTFIEQILLDRVREDIRDTRKLNVHLFNSLKKATYKPAAWFKGLLFPLVESGTCTLREAHIICGVLSRVSIPSLHSAAALMRLTDIAAEQAFVSTESSGATNIFIKTLLEKRYTLPYKVVDNLVFHFLRFRAADPAADHAMTDGTSATGNAGTIKDLKLPVLWHQTLLAFAQRYRDSITEDQREALLDLLVLRGHKDIGPEVRRELLAGRGRGVAIPTNPTDDGDDTMIIDPL